MLHGSKRFIEIFGIHHSAALDKHFILTGSINVFFLVMRGIFPFQEKTQQIQENNMQTLHDKSYLTLEKHQMEAV